MTSDSGKLTGEELNAEEFDWIQLRQDIGAESLNLKPETAKDKFLRKFNENPFVPVGCLLTTMALTYGLWSFRNGQKHMSQRMMRYRIGAQGFTVAALMIGLGTNLAGKF